MPLSEDFKSATWRGTTNTDGRVIGVSFDLAEGGIVRLSLDLSSARNLAETIAEYLAAYEVRTNVHSARSSGSGDKEPA